MNMNSSVISRISVQVILLITFAFVLGIRQTTKSRIFQSPKISKIAERQFYITTVSGLENILANEISQLSNAKNIRIEKGGVFFTGDSKTAIEGLFWLRTSLKLMEKVIEGQVESKDDLYALCSSVDWTAMIDQDSTIKCDTTIGIASPELSHTHFTSLTLKNSIVDQFRNKLGVRPSVDIVNPDLSILLYLHAGYATLYRVWSGDSSMHKRGYRDTVHVAALRESTAAAIILATEWNPIVHRTLCDPMCGSGTIAIEAALIATNTAPGLIRYGHSDDHTKIIPTSIKWSKTDITLYNDIWTNANNYDKRREYLLNEHPIVCIANDIHPNAIEIAKKSAVKAGVYNLISFSNDDIEYYKPNIRSNFIVTNPPWDIRLNEGAEESWRKLGLFVRSNSVSKDYSNNYNNDDNNSNNSKDMDMKNNKNHIDDIYDNDDGNIDNNDNNENDSDTNNNIDNDKNNIVQNDSSKNTVNVDSSKNTVLWALSGNPKIMEGLDMRPSCHIPIRGAAVDMRLIRYDYKV